MNGTQGDPNGARQSQTEDVTLFMSSGSMSVAFLSVSHIRGSESDRWEQVCPYENEWGKESVGTDVFIIVKPVLSQSSFPSVSSA